MPFYEYQCRACSAQVEVMQKISDPPLRKCPECGKSQLTRLISAPVFRLKGAGWYETDFKSDKENKRNLVGAEKDDAPAKDKAADASVKPADKTEGDKKPAADKLAGDAATGAAKPAAKPPTASKTASKSRPAPKPAKRAAGKKARR